MKRQFSFIDAKKLFRKHQRIQYRINVIEKSSLNYRHTAYLAVQQYLYAEGIKILQSISIEEIKRYKQGIRIKTLEDSGYTTYADIFAASVYQLASIRGISENSAKIVKEIVNNAFNEMQKTVKLKLNVDHKTTETTRLIVALTQYLDSKQLSEKSEKIAQQYAHDIQEALDDVKVSTNVFRWLFSSKQKKEKAVQAYQFLEEQLNGEYGNKAEGLSNNSRNIMLCSENHAWESFSKQPVQYINTLESIAPEVLENDDDAYGLPEELARAVQEECFFPEGLKRDLRRYQEWGVKYILHQKKVLLGDEMGLGKTIQSIAAMVSLKNTGARHFVVICPASVMINWYREIQESSKLRAIVVHGSDRVSALNDWLDTGGVAITTYGTTVHFKIPDGFQYSLLTVDEAHYIKNPSTNRSKNVRTIAEHAERILFMTGTAMENNVDEMVNLIRLLQPNIARQIAGMKMLSSAPKFRETIAPVYFRRKREDVLPELPELVEAKEWCELGEVEKEKYEEAVLRKSYHEARRVSWNVDDLHKSSKAKRLLEIVDQAKSENRKILVFSFYLDTIQKIARLLGDQCTEPINGSISPKRRQEIVDKFEKASAGKVLAAQIIAGGTGLNIQAASVVILCEPQLKPSIENQAISRVYRMGQHEKVLVYHLLSVNTIDEKITDLLAEKQRAFDAFADQSVAAANIEIDQKGLGNIIQEEIDRINEERNVA